MGRFLVILLVGSAILAGAGMYYLQVHAYYDELPARESIEVAGVGEVPVRDFTGIDSDSSPIRFRACFTLDAAALEGAALEGAAPYARPTPLVAPRWFDCFDAEAIDTALAAGAARAFLAKANITYGVDRVLAVTPEGRGFAWHQINACGTAHFDGDPVPEGCPSPPSEES